MVNKAKLLKARQLACDKASIAVEKFLENPCEATMKILEKRKSVVDKITEKLGWRREEPVSQRGIFPLSERVDDNNPFSHAIQGCFGGR